MGFTIAELTAKPFSFQGMVPNIPENLRGRKTPKRERKPIFDKALYQERFFTTLASVCLVR